MNRFRTSRRLGDQGVSSIEFALSAMVLVGLLVCATDLVNYLRTRLRVDQVSSGMASSITNYQQLYAGDFNDLFNLAQQTAGDIDVTHVAGAARPAPPGGVYPGGATVFTGIANPNGTPVVAWRQRIGDSSYNSDFGAVGSAPQKLPDSYVVPAGSSVIAVEVFTSVRPWVVSFGGAGVAGPTIVQSAALFQPRAALLTQITGGNRP